MTSSFSLLDWAIVGAYLLGLFAFAWFSQRRRSESAKDYFLGGNNMSMWVVSVSVLATTQSAATFLGGPDQGFRGDYSYLGASLAAIIAAIFVGHFLIPRFYESRCTTVYEMIGERCGPNAMRAAGAMYLVGRLFASGARLYLAAIAVAMILFSNIEAQSIVIAAFTMTILGFLITFLGGIRSVLWSDLLQFVIYVTSALMILVFLYNQIPGDISAVMDVLREAPDGQNKLRLWNTNFNISDPFSLLSILTGLVLLNIANSGLDQDTTQRLLTCKDHRSGAKALVFATLMSVPVIWVFVSIGQLLHIFYERPEVMGLTQQGLQSEFGGERITVFMHYILSAIPDGLKGLATIGVIAASISTINSGLNSMSSVLIEDFYRPWRQSRQTKEERHYVLAGRVGMGLIGVALFLMSILCYYWQRYTDMPLLDFALSVMTFAYAGLLGVYFTLLFTRRGSAKSVMAALFVGFLASTVQQSVVVDYFALPTVLKEMAFTWKLLIGTLLAFAVCQCGSASRSAKMSFQTQ